VKRRWAWEFGWWVVGGAVLGFVAAAVVDAFVSPWQGWWTGLAVGTGAVCVPAAAAILARRWRVSAEEASTVRAFLGLARAALVWLATFCAPYVVIWVYGRGQTHQWAFSVGAVGVLVWPLLAVLARAMLGWPAVHPMLWMLFWLFGGVLVTAALLAIRVGDGYGGVVLGFLVLLPIAIVRYSRTSRRRRSRRPREDVPAERM